MMGSVSKTDMEALLQDLENIEAPDALSARTLERAKTLVSRLLQDWDIAVSAGKYADAEGFYTKTMSLFNSLASSSIDPEVENAARGIIRGRLAKIQGIEVIEAVEE